MTNQERRSEILETLAEDLLLGLTTPPRAPAEIIRKNAATMSRIALRTETDVDNVVKSAVLLIMEHGDDYRNEAAKLLFNVMAYHDGVDLDQTDPVETLPTKATPSPETRISSASESLLEIAEQDRRVLFGWVKGVRDRTINGFEIEGTYRAACNRIAALPARRGDELETKFRLFLLLITRLHSHPTFGKAAEAICSSLLSDFERMEAERKRMGYPERTKPTQPCSPNPSSSAIEATKHDLQNTVHTISDQTKAALTKLDRLIQAYNAVHALTDAGEPIGADIEREIVVYLCGRIEDLSIEMTQEDLEAGTARVRYHCGLG